MYSSFTVQDRVAIKTALAIAWGFSVIAGVGGIFLTPNTVAQELGWVIPLLCGVITLASSFAAALGVIFDKYQIEWVAAWFAASGMFAYVVTVWYLVFSGTPTRLQQAANLTSLLFFYIYRITSCSANARKQRTIHELVLSGEMGLPNSGK